MTSKKRVRVVGERNVPGLMVFCSRASQALSSHPMIYEEMGTEPSWAQSRCGTGFYILNKPVKEKQCLIFVLEDVPEQAKSVCLAVETVAEAGKGRGKKINVLGQEGASCHLHWSSRAGCGAMGHSSASGLGETVPVPKKDVKE